MEVYIQHIQEQERTEQLLHQRQREQDVERASLQHSLASLTEIISSTTYQLLSKKASVSILRRDILLQQQSSSQIQQFITELGLRVKDLLDCNILPPHNCASPTSSMELLSPSHSPAQQMCLMGEPYLQDIDTMISLNMTMDNLDSHTALLNSASTAAHENQMQKTQTVVDKTNWDIGEIRRSHRDVAEQTKQQQSKVHDLQQKIQPLHKQIEILNGCLQHVIRRIDTVENGDSSDQILHQKHYHDDEDHDMYDSDAFMSMHELFESNNQLKKDIQKTQATNDKLENKLRKERGDGGLMLIWLSTR